MFGLCVCSDDVTEETEGGESDTTTQAPDSTTEEEEEATTPAEEATTPAEGENTTPAAEETTPGNSDAFQVPGEFCPNDNIPSVSFLHIYL